MISRKCNKHSPGFSPAELYLLLFILLLAPAYSFPDSQGEDLLAEAQIDYKNGNYEQAIPKLTKALQLLSNSEKKADAHLILGLIYFDDRKDDQAKIEFAEARKLNPYLELDREHHSPDTIEAFNQAKQDGVTCFQRGEALYRQGKDEEALQQLNTAINLLQAADSQKNQVLIVNACLMAAKIYDSVGNNDLMIQEFQKALGSNPDLELNPQDYTSRFIDLFQQAKTEGNRVVEKAQNLIEKKEYDSAVALLEKNSALYFTKATKKEAALSQAVAFYSAKKEAQAVQALKVLLNLDPAYVLQNEMKNSPFGEFFQLQRMTAGGKLPKILIVKGQDNPIHNLTIEGFSKEIVGERKEIGIKDLKKELGSYMPDAIFVTGNEALRSANKLNTKTSIIFANVPRSDAMAFKSANIGGIYFEVSLDEQFSILRAVLPMASKVGVFYNKEYSGALIEEAKKKASNYNLEVDAREIEEAGDIVAGMNQFKEIDAFWMLLDPSTASMDAWGEVIRATSKRKIPVFAYGNEDLAKRGALFALSYNFRSIGKQAAELTQKVLILHPDTVPLLYPSFSRVAINLAVAKQLNVEISPNLITKDTIVFR
jgi:ABC-type uncharacterized transport system substrate-binding protein